MTSPRQRKKRMALLAKKKRTEETKIEPKKLEEKTQLPVAPEIPSVVQSTLQQFKAKKVQSKNALVEIKPEETKSSDQVVEQPKKEVKTETKE